MFSLRFNKFFLLCISLISVVSATAEAQVLFDIDDATVSNGDVTQSVVFNGSTFELTATHSTNSDAVLFNLDGAGDNAFFWGGTGTADPLGWRLSLTQDGAPTAFSLEQIQYESFGSGNTFDLLNDSGAAITTGFAVPANGTPNSSGLFAIDNVANATDVLFVDLIGTSGNFATIGTDFHNIRLTPSTAVPEPNSLVVLGVFCSIMSLRRRTRN